MAYKIIILLVSGIILVAGALALTQAPDYEKRILEATVMITITAPELETAAPSDGAPANGGDEALPIPPDEYRAIARPDSYVTAEGLGTLVNLYGELVIVTHDHWSVLESPLGLVQIRNGRGQLLADMQLMKFKKLIRRRDGGTMIVSAPNEVAARVQPEQTTAQDSPAANVAAGDVVSLVYRQRDGGNGLAVMQVAVESLGRKQGLPVVRLNTAESSPIAGGDSGGGVWLNGELVANTWTTIMMANSQTGESRPANSSIAALMDNDWTG